LLITPEQVDERSEK
jgi:hypothetical protein